MVSLAWTSAGKRRSPEIVMKMVMIFVSLRRLPSSPPCPSRAVRERGKLLWM